MRLREGPVLCSGCVCNVGDRNCVSLLYVFDAQPTSTGALRRAGEWVMLVVECMWQCWLV